MSRLTSVVIPCYNAEKWIFDTLESIFSLNNNIPLEVIVVDDGSTDKSVDIVKSNFLDVNIIKIKNQGPSVARNIGTANASGDYIQYLDADDLLYKGKIEKQINLLEKTGADVAYGNWQKLRKGDDGEYHKSEIVRRQLINPEIDLFTTFWCPPAVYLFRKKIVEKVGEWNVTLPIIQDARFALDCALNDAEFFYCDEIMAYYRVHNSDSVSKRDSLAFVRDCYTNTCQIEKWWNENGGMTEDRKNALENCLGYITLASFKNDKETYQNAYLKLFDINAEYIPNKGVVSDKLILASKIFGYQNALFLSYYYNKIKNIFYNSK